MNEVDFLHRNKTQNLLLEKRVKMKVLGVHQQKDAVPNQTSDDRQLLEVKEEEEVPHLWSSSLDQQDPELLIIKKEEEELWSSDEGEECPAKTHDEERSQLFQFHQIKTEVDRETEPPTSSSAEQIKTETDGEDCGGPAGPQAEWKSALPADVLQVVIKEEVPFEWSSSLDQQDPEPFHINKDEDNLWSCQDEEHLHVQDITRFPYNKYDEDKMESSQFYQIKTEDNEENEPSTSRIIEYIKTETDEEDYVEPELGRKPDLSINLKHIIYEKTSVEISNGEWQEPMSDSGPETEFILDSEKTVPTRAKPFHCDLCGKGFRRRYLLTKHATVHTREKPYVCGFCSKRFSQQGNLQRHMSFHTGENPFGCDVCGYRFNKEMDLTKHMRVHTTEYPCEICGKCLKYPSDLTKHMKVHTVEATFHCDVCGKSFKYKSNLRKHTRVHTGEAPFQCEVCGKSFKYKCDLRKHTGVHTGETPFQCDVCKKRFRCQYNLKKHQSLHTQGQTTGK
ncbi:gastrula zinc finger protein XlCGF57.1 [Nematolebias whitei]|uniref:gastrula zinc finger protein XlCGF57.1 n=1 Tax=Nematolebias whitei TaxID=451745 RepID=UPI001896ACDC|nr:gastrula zinc finger protein XlCGF57.1 [Nematolebias whitei]